MGHSKAKPSCTTYSSPTLSSCEEFDIDSIEVWGVGTPSLPEVSSEMLSAFNYICEHQQN